MRGGWGGGSEGVHSTPQEVWCAVTVTVCPVGFQFCCKVTFFFSLVKDPMSLENEVPFSGSVSNLILKLVPSDG